MTVSTPRDLCCGWAVVLLGLIAGSDARTQAHKGAISPYSYAEHVLPILRAHCGVCHFEGGSTPMSLLTYESSSAWVESIREQLLSEALPPHGLDARDSLSAREIDVILSWAAGTAPRESMGPPDREPAHEATWTLGVPDLTVSMAQPHNLRASTAEDVARFVLPTHLNGRRWVRAVELLPGTRSVVRNALVEVENGPVLAVWDYAHSATVAPAEMAFELPPDAKIVLTIHYKKNYRDFSHEMADRSQVGLYFLSQPPVGGTIQTVELVGGCLERATRVVALQPTLDHDYASLRVDAALPNSRKSLLFMRSPRAAWPQRYWLDDPIDLPAGTVLTATVMPTDGDLERITTTVRLKLDVVTPQADRRAP